MLLDLSAEYRGPEVLALEKESNIINSIAALDGTPIFEFSVQCPSDFTNSKEILRRIVPPKDSIMGKHCPIAYNSALLESTRSQETVMSCAVYSPMTGATVVGYHSGALCAFYARNSVDSSTNSIHEHYSSFRFNAREVCSYFEHTISRLMPNMSTGARLPNSGPSCRSTKRQRSRILDIC